jgi:hypothetical protein
MAFAGKSDEQIYWDRARAMASLQPHAQHWSQSQSRDIASRSRPAHARAYACERTIKLFELLKMRDNACK